VPRNRYSAARGIYRLRVSLSRPGGCNIHPFRLVDTFEATGSPVPCQRLSQARATCTPDTAWAVSRHPPDSSRDSSETTVSMSPFSTYDASSVVRSRSPSWLTPAGLAVRLFPQRSRPRLFTDAPCGGLGSPPARRSRRAHLHHRHSTARSRINSLPSHSWHNRACRGSPQGSRQTPGSTPRRSPQPPGWP
jgi:hypothetical protein